MKTACPICPRHCLLAPGQTGFCRAREGSENGVVCSNYGLLTSLSMDPVEKKPLKRFFPGSMILSSGSFGCNLRCPHCQNYVISMSDGAFVRTAFFSPGDLVKKACGLKAQGNIGIAYTYNEPLISYEYIRDCAAAARNQGLKNVLVTNGYVCREPLAGLLPLIDAMNIDLKAFTEDFYRQVGGDLQTVMDTIAAAASSCHVEVTTLVIPGKNDSEEEMDALASWLSSINREIPLHISRFFPCYRENALPPTPVSTVYGLAETARRHLTWVYTGNC